MSEKELLYIDDALGHFESINEFITDFIDEVEDENFVSILEELEKVNSDIYKKFYKLGGK